MTGIHRFRNSAFPGVAVSFPGKPGKQRIQMIGERLPVALTERRRTLGLYAAGAQGIHEIPHDQPLFYAIRRIKLTAGIEHMPTLLYHFCRQRDVAGDNKISRVDPFDDLVVSDIEPGRHLEHPDVG